MAVGGAGGARWLAWLAVLCWAGSERVEEVVRGEIGGGNSSVYAIQRPGSLELVLESVEGDADLYVSARTEHPGWPLDAHEWQATSCGLDRLRIPASATRPLHISVYGHPSAPSSSYALLIRLTPPSATPRYDDYLHNDRSDQDHDDDDEAGDRERLQSPDESRDSGSKLEGFLELLGSVLSFLLHLAVEVLT